METLTTRSSHSGASAGTVAIAFLLAEFRAERDAVEQAIMVLEQFRELSYSMDWRRVGA